MIGPKTTYARLLHRNDIFRIPGENVYWTAERVVPRHSDGLDCVITTSGHEILIKGNTRVRLFRRQPWHPSQGPRIQQTGEDAKILTFPAPPEELPVGCMTIDGEQREFVSTVEIQKAIMETVLSGGDVFAMLKERLKDEEES